MSVAVAKSAGFCFGVSRAVDLVEQAVREGNAAAMQCDFTRDVMAMMTKVRKDWGMQYPGEEW